MRNNTRDSLVSTSVIACTPMPQRVCWLALHQDYSSEPVDLNIPDKPDSWFGKRVVDKCIKFGHWGVTEHPSITVIAKYYPHDVISQARTHRVGVSFDVQSFRYTGENLLNVYTLEDLEKVVYFRPAGEYTDRKGHKYVYTDRQREVDTERAFEAITNYKYKLSEGFSEEHARQMLPYSYRQHFVVSFNLRSLMHFLDLRGKADAQIEIQWLADDLMEIFRQWCPEVASWYENNRWKKARLAP